MSEENTPPPSDAEDASKAETIRITLPPKQEQAVVKRETVRINLPGRAGAPAGSTPKKETTKLPSAGAPVPPSAPSAPGVPTAPPAAPSAPGIPAPPKTSAPPPPKPLGGVTPAPPSLGKPLGGVTPAPKPPTAGGAPTAPARPAAPVKPAPIPGSPLGGGPTPAPSPVTQKAAAPKKETARITLPPEGAKPALPKATVKMGQTQPLVNRPTTTAPAAVIAAAPAAALAEAPADGSPLLGIVSLVFSLVSFLLVLLAYSASNS